MNGTIGDWSKQSSSSNSKSRSRKPFGSMFWQPAAKLRLSGRVGLLLSSFCAIPIASSGAPVDPAFSSPLIERVVFAKPAASRVTSSVRADRGILKFREGPIAGQTSEAASTYKRGATTS